MSRTKMIVNQAMYHIIINILILLEIYQMKDLFTKPYAENEKFLTAEEKAQYLLENEFVKDVTYDMLVKRIKKAESKNGSDRQNTK